MTPEQERVSSILLDTVALLCKNSLSFSTELKIQGLIGITMDGNDVFLIHINELFNSESAEPVKQEPVEVGDHHMPRPSQNFNERRLPKRHSGRKPVMRTQFSHSNQMDEDDEAYDLKPNIKSEVGYDDPTSTFGEFGYVEDTVLPPKVKPISMMRQTQVTYGSGPSDSTVASTIVTEAFNMVEEEEAEEEVEEGLDSPEEPQEQLDEMPWDSASGNTFFQHPLDQSELDPAPTEVMWTGAMPASRSSAYGFGHKAKRSVRGRGTPGMRGRQAMSSPALARLKPCSSNPYIINETSHLCGYPNCGKRFRFRHDLLRHQTKKHGRTPVGRGRGHRIQGFAEFG